MMIRKFFIISSLLLGVVSTIDAKVTLLDYKATFGIFGTVGTIKNRLTKTEKYYQIDTVVKLAGLAKILLGGQTEHYISKGHMEHGLMVSDMYQMISKKGDKVTSKVYRIYHHKKYVIKHSKQWVKGKLVHDNTQKLSFYAKNDLLTLYFNLGYAVKKKGTKYIFKAVGLEKQNGKVQITVPSDRDNDAYKKDLGSDAMLYAKALIVQENFRKKQGDILLAVSKDGFIKKSVIKDILLYGDAELIRTN
jgi:hypothetical protein